MNFETHMWLRDEDNVAIGEPELGRFDELKWGGEIHGL